MDASERREVFLLGQFFPQQRTKSGLGVLPRFFKNGGPVRKFIRYGSDINSEVIKGPAPWCVPRTLRFWGRGNRLGTSDLWSLEQICCTRPSTKGFGLKRGLRMTPCLLSCSSSWGGWGSPDCLGVFQSSLLSPASKRMLGSFMVSLNV